METYVGHVRTPADAIILFEACRLGLLPRVQRRLSEKERQLIKSGSVFVWDEREAGMRRWTDGKSWSASRVNGSFLTYREMEGKRGNQSGARTNPVQDGQDSASSPTQANGPMDASVGYGNRYGMETADGYRYKVDGLTKQSFSITTSSGQHLHLISYFTRPPPGQLLKLMQPTNDPAIKHIRPAKGMYPESTAQDGNNMPAMTQSPMMGAPYAPSPGQQSASSTPQFPSSRNLYNHSPSYGWPPSPMSTPPTHPQAHYSPYQSGYANGAGHSPTYYPHPAGHQRVHAPQGQTAFDRAPPPLSGGGMPQPPSAPSYASYPSMPPTSIPAYQYPPAHQYSYSVQHSPPAHPPQYHYPSHYSPPPAPGAGADPRMYQPSSQYPPPQEPVRRDPDVAPMSNGHDSSEKGVRIPSSSGTLPSIGALINQPETSNRVPNGQPSISSNGIHEQQVHETSPGMSDKAGFKEGARALRQLDKAFAP